MSPFFLQSFTRIFATILIAAALDGAVADDTAAQKSPLDSAADVVESFGARPRIVHSVDFQARISLVVDPWRMFRLQDGTHSIQARIEQEKMPQLAKCHVGDLVRVTGVTSSKENTLLIDSIEVISRGDATDLQTRPAFVDGRTNFWKYVHFEGTVAEVLQKSWETRIRFKEFDGRIWWSLYSTEQLSDQGLLGRRMRVEGLMMGDNPIRPIDGRLPRIISTTPEQYRLLESDHAPETPTEDVVRLKGFISHVGDDYIVACGHRIHTTMCSPLHQNIPVFVQGVRDAKQPLHVRAMQIVCLYGQKRRPLPLAEADLVQQRATDYEVVHTRGTVKEHRSGPGHDELLMTSDGLIFRAVLPKKQKGQLHSVYSAGQQARVTGAVFRDKQKYPDDAFGLYVSTIDDLQLDEPAFQVYREQLLWGAGIATVCLLGGIFWHIALRRKVSQKTKELSQLNAQIVAAAAAVRNGILILDEQGRVIQFNQNFQKMFGEVAPNQLSTDVFDRCLKHRFLNAVPFEQLWNAHQPTTPGDEARELPLANRDGWVSVKTAAVKGSSGKPAGRVWTFEDISERKRLEREYFHAQKLQAIGRLAGGIAHDFNNLLQVVNANLETMKLTAAREGSEVQSTLELASQAVDRGADLTRQLLTFSKGSIIQKKSAPVNPVVQQVVSLLDSIMDANVTISVDLDPNVSVADIDPGQIEQVLMNLCINSRDAIGEDQGQICISTSNAHHEELGECVRISVKDDGCGISDEAALQIFEPFYSTKSDVGGHGLGLSVALGIIQQHEGRLTCSSREGNGTQFDVFLRPGEAVAESQPPIVTDPISKSTESRVRILLIDDDSMIRTAGAMLLKRMGHQVTTAPDGVEGLEILAEEGQFDCVILDMTMPRMSGRETLSEIRQRHPGQKVIICSGYADETQKIRSSDRAQPDGFLSKPFNVAALSAILSDVVSPVRHTA